MAKLRLADREKNERGNSDLNAADAEGKMTFGEAIALFCERVEKDAALKPRTKAHRKERISVIRKTDVLAAGSADAKLDPLYELPSRQLFILTPIWCHFHVHPAHSQGSRLGRLGRVYGETFWAWAISWPKCRA